MLLRTRDLFVQRRKFAGCKCKGLSGCKRHERYTCPPTPTHPPDTTGTLHWNTMCTRPSLLLLILSLVLLFSLRCVRCAPVRGGPAGATYTPYLSASGSSGSAARCFSSAELSALGVTPLADGARYAAGGLATLQVERNPWPGHFASTAMLAILVEEALNLPVRQANAHEDRDGGRNGSGRSWTVWPNRC